MEKIAMINMFRKLDDKMEISVESWKLFLKESNGNGRTEIMNKIHWV